MHPRTVAIIVFFVAAVGYSWLGILFMASTASIFNFNAGEFQLVIVVSVILALLTAAYANKLESA